MESTPIVIGKKLNQGSGTLLETQLRKEALAEDLQAKLRRSHIPALDGIRAIAVFLVVFYHFGILWIPGGTGVTMFFVLSGFLITWLLLQENEKYGRVSLAAFYRRRVLRIFPAFYAYWIVVVLLLLITGKSLLWSHAISSFFYVSNYYNAINGDPNTLFSHTWSLAIEEQFYLLWPIAFSRLRSDLRKLTWLLMCVILAVWIHRVVLYFLGADQGYIYAAFDTRLDSLMVGCLLAVLLKRKILMSFWAFLCSNLLLPLAVVLMFVISTYFAHSFWGYRDTIGFAIDPLLIGVWLVQLISFSSHSYVKWIETPVVRFFGRISYSIYLYQQLTVDSIHRRLVDKPFLLQLVAAIGATVIIATISYYVIERPFLKLKNVKLHRKEGELVSSRS